ncbi:NADPH:quinone oxidoreductase family protein [Algiphilus sp. W345]|uniref:NADPH:quinone oxidoreductase family protein n=1 Tax=Banduia mediterranea TaxID=3075609 RepID=A0ABU2WHG0_9GAMM|nr:NADPH:quinone oxidoreductase family protein [Algiphilus sp. W345]MDT0496689.1 NADPH:quinone oxidoreductase family protein [Algiphilus sp. W345]
MKAIVCKEFGPPEKLVFEDVELPALKPNEVRIAVKAAGVNFPDTLIIENRYQFKGTPPFVPGAEAAGKVIECGEKIRHLRPGDMVAALLTTGAFAEEAITSGENVLPIPQTMSPVDAAVFPMMYGTTLYALKQRGQLKSGETLLVLGAAGGVGLAAVQIGKLMGARVIAAASSDDKLAVCAAHGADELVNYADTSLKDAVKQLTGGAGADVIYDPVGGPLAQDCLSCINWNGRYLVIGFAAGSIPEIAANRLLLKGASAVGVFWGAFVSREPQASFDNFQQLFEWYAEDRLKPMVSKTYPLAEAAQALQDMLERKVTGKLALTT